jgi:hypothetical protein
MPWEARLRRRPWEARHIVPRYPDGPAPGRPLPDAVFTNAPTLSAEDLTAQLTRLRHHLE